MTSDLIDRRAAIDAIQKLNIPEDMCVFEIMSHIGVEISTIQTIDAVQVVRCKDCKHRPSVVDDEDEEDVEIEFPDCRCPCQCEDYYYSWMPKDNWFCANGERKES